jgi:hypothetical protein
LFCYTDLENRDGNCALSKLYLNPGLEPGLNLNWETTLLWESSLGISNRR